MGVQRERDLTGMPAAVPELSDDQYSLPELVGAMFDRTILADDALRPVADVWCRHALNGLFRMGRVVRPLRDAAEKVRAVARVAAAAASALEEDFDDRLTTSFVSSTGVGCCCSLLFPLTLTPWHQGSALPALYS